MSSTTSMPSSTATAPPAASSSGSSGSGSGDSGSTTKPFLFFVALGFGVVFTNLWIIVGIKYCFRYNQRARQALIDQENLANGIDMAAVPNNRRRRREKKLMTMDEVNDRFPMTKYKIWRTNREQEGLPSAGGITAPPSRAGSIRAVAPLARLSTEDDTARPVDAAPAQAVANPAKPSDGAEQTATATRDFATNKSVPEKSHVSIEVRETAKDTPAEPNPTQATATEYFSGDRPETAAPAPATTAADTTTTDAVAVATADHKPSDHSDSDDEDAIANALPDTLLESPGDSCAICIEPLDDDDEIRGLSCGHAFHASCLDPWLTTRKACCPLCKADYYVPKPRPEAETIAPPPPILMPLHPRMFFGGFRSASPAQARETQRQRGGVGAWGLAPPTRGQLQREVRQSSRRHQQATTTDAAADADADTATPRPGMAQRLTAWIPGRRRQAASTEPASAEASTPAQLEAGTGTQAR